MIDSLECAHAIRQDDVRWAVERRREETAAKKIKVYGGKYVEPCRLPGELVVNRKCAMNVQASVYDCFVIAGERREEAGEQCMCRD